MVHCLIIEVFWELLSATHTHTDRQNTFTTTHMHPRRTRLPLTAVYHTTTPTHLMIAEVHSMPVRLGEEGSGFLQ